MNRPRYVVGIDLGTTNTVLAYAEAGSDAQKQLLDEVAAEDRGRVPRGDLQGGEPEGRRDAIGRRFLEKAEGRKDIGHGGNSVCLVPLRQVPVGGIEMLREATGRSPPFAD